MEKYDLAGEWQLGQDGGAVIPGQLPGSTYLDYMANGMDDPFWGENETAAKELARHDYCYSRMFELPEKMLKARHLELVADGLDTLCTIIVNGKQVGNTNNINRIWRLDIKAQCKPGENAIALDFANPYPVTEAMQAADPLPSPMTPMDGMGHLRKTPCHFGWDWGPELPPAGVARSIRLEAWNIRVEDLRITQLHKNGEVFLHVAAVLSAGANDDDIQGRLTLMAPDGSKHTYAVTAQDGRLIWKIQVKDPQLWWCNGLGDHPLYQLEVAVTQNDREVDRLHRQIGLRTIELDTAPDAYGNQFRFLVNNVPIFAKGANWIPPDSFITRADRETMNFYIEAAQRANMNMIRVWGGGMYENEDFYDACDRCGILVWQDFLFACNPYPLHDETFVAGVHAEVEDNVRRLRHRASLALWCGNNECEVFTGLWKKGSKERESNPAFYHRTLRKWMEELDGVTPYWPGSPSSGSPDKRLHSMKEGATWGDTHLWHIWHGMCSIETFREFPTRFCSEYGMESMPSMHTIRSFTDESAPGLFDPVMMLHQKCGSGNAKMLYYLLAKYRNPAEFEDFIYLSQLVQANTVRFATDCWRRNIGRQNGALYWQMNDCWPVVSWAGIDYGRQLKAVTYQARHFNKMLCLSNDYFNDRAELYVVNEYPRAFTGRLEWSLLDFVGGRISSGSQTAEVGAVASKRVVTLCFADILNGRKKTEAALEVRLLDGDEVQDRKYWLLVPDKKAALPKTRVKATCAVEDCTAAVTLTSAAYARYVYVEADGVTAPWSDNFFDIPAGESVTLQVTVPEGMNAAELEKRLRVKNLADVEPKNGLLKDKWLRFAMMMGNGNFRGWLIYKFILR